jgi:hypothetical protein
MTQKGHYAELYNTYFRHQSPDYDISHPLRSDPVKPGMQLEGVGVEPGD